MPHDGWHPHDHSHGHDHHHDEHGHHRHAHPTRRLILAAASFLPFGGATAQTVEAGERIAQAANRFLAALDDEQRGKALIAFDSPNREDWHYVPRSRQGLPLAAMKPEQRTAARALFASTLSERGLQMIDNVRVLEGVLREQQGSWRDPERYYVSVFGTPGRFPWGWRFEGHHLSLNVALAAAGHITATPFFVGRTTGIEWFNGLGEAVTIVTGLMFVICVMAFRRGLVGEFQAWWARRHAAVGAA